eukprot:TRINITY_DN498_c0_g4_i1.p1 TRINITY_DN498_c0_g4~~TRINITY_DN498_c0_g4_i1.p1  ORF type:complete len:529 (+),score=79.00 TRINITY_DN498_c0_g4_i1:388-1974(+)
MLKLRSIQFGSLYIYQHFFLLTCLAFFVVILYRVVNFSTSSRTIYNLLYGGSLLPQWFVQIAVVMWMFEDEINNVGMRHTFFRTLISSILLFLIFLISFKYDGTGDIGLVIIEIIFILFFGAILVRLLFFGKGKGSRQIPRSVALYWSVFQFIIHLLFTFPFLVSQYWSESLTMGVMSDCTTLFGNLFYFILYSPILYMTVNLDIAFWKKKLSILRTASSINSTEKDSLLQSTFNDAGLREIDYAELQFGDVIGVGSHGVVYKGVWKNLHVAIKQFKVTSFQRASVTGMIQESRLLSSLRHPNILMLLGVSADNENIAIVTEFMPKGSLFDLLHRDPEKEVDSSPVELSDITIVQIAMDIARGLSFLHTLNPPIMHRDVKSANILLDENLRCKVGDFSVSRVMNSQTMTSVGTPNWMSPEVLRAERYTEKADVFSFGLVLYELATRKIPHHGLTAYQVIYKVVNSLEFPLPLPTEFISPIFVNLMKRCLDYDPEKRPTMSVAYSDLEKLHNQLNRTTSSLILKISDII